MSTLPPEIEHQSHLQTLTVPFTVPNRGPCTVTITVQPSTDTVRIGQALIGLYADSDVVRGFPVAHGRVLSPHWHAYAAIYGWMQLTTQRGQPYWVMDPYPPFEDVNTPFVSWGAEPSLVDAPGRDGTVKTLDWTAQSWLTYSPDGPMSKNATPILGFEWGFWLHDAKPYVKPLKQIDVKCWDEHLELFRKKYPGWTFTSVAEQKGEEEKKTEKDEEKP